MKECSSKTKNINKLVVILVAFGIILIVFSYIYNIFFPLKKNNVRNEKNESLVLTGNMNLDSIYRREVIANSGFYASSNEAIIAEKENLEINNDNVISNDDRFNNCSGTMMVSKDYENYIFSTDGKCNKESSKDERNIEYKSYSGNIMEIFEVDDGVVIASKVDVNNDDYNVLLTLFDNFGNKKWSTKYNELNSEGNVNSVEILSINNYNDGYVVNLKSVPSIAECKAIFIDMNGKILKEKRISNSKFQVSDILAFIAEDDNKLFFHGLASNATDVDIPVIISIDNSNMDIIDYEYEKNDDVTIVRNILFVRNGNFYGNSVVIDGQNVIKRNIIFKMNSSGKVILEKEIKEISPDVYINDLYATSDGSLYINYLNFSSDDNALCKLSGDLVFDVAIKYSALLADKKVEFVEFLSGDGYLSIRFNDLENNKNYILLMDSSNKVVDNILVSLENVNDQFQQSYLYKSIVDVYKVIQVYTSSDSLSNENIIFAFYN